MYASKGEQYLCVWVSWCKKRERESEMPLAAKLISSQLGREKVIFPN